MEQETTRSQAHRLPKKKKKRPTVPIKIPDQPREKLYHGMTTLTYSKHLLARTELFFTHPLFFIQLSFQGIVLPCVRPSVPMQLHVLLSIYCNFVLNLNWYFAKRCRYIELRFYLIRSRSEFLLPLYMQTYTVTVLCILN